MNKVNTFSPLLRAYGRIVFSYHTHYIYICIYTIFLSQLRRTYYKNSFYHPPRSQRTVSKRCVAKARAHLAEEIPSTMCRLTAMTHTHRSTISSRGALSSNLPRHSPSSPKGILLLLTSYIRIHTKRYAPFGHDANQSKISKSPHQRRCIVPFSPLSFPLLRQRFAIIDYQSINARCVPVQVPGDLFAALVERWWRNL